METVKLSIPAGRLRPISRPRKRKRLISTSPPQLHDEESPHPENLQNESSNESSASIAGWRPVPRTNLLSAFQDAAVLSLEEIDGVEVQYETTELGKTAKLVKVSG